MRTDEPDEVAIVKNALREHLDMDAKVTLSVLCDQIAPLDDTIDEEEQDIRDRLRKVVLKFLTEDARKEIVERHALPGNGAEETLIDTLLKVIPKLGYKDVEIIVEELLLKLKAFRTPSTSPRGSELLQALLAKVTEWLHKATRSDGGKLLRSAQPYLDLAGFVVVEKRVAPAIQLLRTYCSSISTKLNLHKFHPDDQQLVVSRLAETFVVANEESSSFQNHGDPPLDTLSRAIVDSCPFLLEALRLTAASPSRHVKACIILLQTCNSRKENSPWTPGPHLITVLSDVQAKFSREQSQDIHNLIRVRTSPFGQSLVPPPSTSGRMQGQVQASLTASTSQPTTNGKGLPASLPDRPATTYPARRMHIASSSRTQGRNPTMVESLSFQAPQSMPAKRQLAPESSSRPPKRQKGTADDSGESDAGPSLLSRLGTSLSTDPTSRTNLAPATIPQTTAQQRPYAAGASEHMAPPGELSIKGAANVGGRNAGPSSSRRPQPVQTPSFSLLDRLERSSASVQGGRSGQWSRRSGGR
ncbi:hypothetical protein C0991_002724 [Blastosporella zonata]|nr:hypothetical protein C0991_002724 [Blastosporella zonata]